MRYLLVALLAVGLVAAPHPPQCNGGHPCPPEPVAMGRLVTSGFEFGLDSVATSPDGSNHGALLATSPVRTGTHSFQSTAAGAGNNRANEWSFTAVALGNDVFLRAAVYVATGSLPSGSMNLLNLGPSFANGPFLLDLETNGTLTLWAAISSVFTQQGSASAPITLDAWNIIELRARVGTGSIDQVEGRLNLVSFASGSGLAVTDTQVTTASVGSVSLNGNNPVSGTAYFDDVAVNDSAGASQTSWPGDGHVALLLPTADSAVGTGWTLGTGTAISSNGFTAVKNTPPLGVTDLQAGSDPKQIRNATSNANVNYDATMTSYAAAGIGPNDTVTVVDPIIVTAAPVTTSSKQGTVGVVSNPAISNVALGATGTAGAFWQGNAASGWSSGWKVSHGTITYAPAVTIGTAPVMRVTQVTASTRIAMVCFMGMYVEYSQGPLPYITPMPPLLAQ